MIGDYGIWRSFGFTRRAALANALIGAECHPPMPCWRQEAETLFQFTVLIGMAGVWTIISLMLISEKASR